MTFYNTSDYPGYYTQIGVIQPFLSILCGNPKVPDILTRLEDVEVLDFVYENSLNEKHYNSEHYTITKNEEYEEYDDDYYNEKAIPEGSVEENEVKNPNKDPSDSTFDLRKDGLGQWS